MEGFQRDVMNYVKPNHGTTTLGFVFKEGVIVACDSRASQGSYICKGSFFTFVVKVNHGIFYMQLLVRTNQIH